MQHLIEYLEDQFQAVIDLQSGMVSIPAMGPANQGEGEKDKADFIKEYLQETGLTDIQEINAPDDRVDCGYRPNLAVKLDGRNPEKTLWIISHLDVVPPGDLKLWESDPFKLKIDGDHIFGRGVEDNHQGIVSSLLAARAFIALGKKPEIGLGLIFVSDEETGNKYGLPYVLGQRPELFAADDLFLVPDFGTSDSRMMEVAEKSMLWIKVSVQGKQCHASTPEKGINSLIAASSFILKLEGLQHVFSRKDHLFSPPCSTFCPTKKEANVPNINTIPGMDIFYVDCRILPNYAVDDVLRQTREIGRVIEKEYKVRIDYEVVLQEQSAPPTDPSSDVVVRLARGIEQVYAVQPTALGVGGGTVAAFLRHKGYPAVVWSTLLGTAHQPNECASVKNTIKDAQVIALMAASE